MDVDILKRAWDITWRYKILWVLGFFALSEAGGGASLPRSYSTGSGGRSGAGLAGAERFGLWVQQNLAALIVLSGALVVIGILFWILGVAARGGLIHLVNEAAEGRTVTAGAGWASGFRHWGRIFLIGFLLGLPVLLLVLVIAFVVATALVGAGVLASRNPGPAVITAITGVCGILVLAAIVLVPLAIVVGILSHLASRHAVIDELPAVESIKAAWRDLRVRFKDVALWWLLMLVVGIGYGFVVFIIALVLTLPAIGLFLVGAWPAGIALGLVAFAVLLLVHAVGNTYFYAAWTIFFRRLTGREAPAPAVAYAPPAYMPPPPPGYGYPPPPQPPLPPQSPPSAPPPPQARSAPAFGL